MTMLGLRHSPETRAKISAAQKGKGGSALRGRKRPEASAWISAYWLGRKRPPEFSAMIARRNRGRTASDETRRKMSLAHSGERNGKWRGGVALGTRRDPRYRVWVRAIFERDDFTCQSCGVRGGDLEADHIKPWATHEELRYEMTNGRTLCRTCHRKTDTWGGRTTRPRASA